MHPAAGSRRGSPEPPLPSPATANRSKRRTLLSPRHRRYRRGPALGCPATSCGAGWLAFLAAAARDGDGRARALDPEPCCARARRQQVGRVPDAASRAGRRPGPPLSPSPNPLSPLRLPQAAALMANNTPRNQVACALCLLSASPQLRLTL